MNAFDLVRPDLRALQPYSSARMEAPADRVPLNANESPWPPYGSEHAWNRYPDPQPAALVARLAALYGVRADQVLAGRGSDEGIDLLVRAFCRAGEDAILISPPTFGMYAVAARIQNAGVVEVPLRVDFTPDVGAIVAAATPAVKLVFVCAPNNPTGAGAARADILRLADALHGRAMLVVDEAYIEFAEPGGDCVSVAPDIARQENLIVLRTLSKAWALAGVRVGAVVAHAGIIALLRKLIAPYPLSLPSIAAALRGVSRNGERAVHRRAAAIRRERARMRAALADLAGVRQVLPSAANFLTVRCADPDGALACLQAAGISVRDVRRYPRLGDALRITLGTQAQNDAVLAALARSAVPARSAHNPAGVHA